MSNSASLAAMAAARAAPPPDVQVAQMRKDKVAAMKLARLKVKANARGAAPPPPGKGGAQPPPMPINTSDGAPPKVEKYRATEAHSGDVTFPEGATLFVLGDADADGNVVAVFDGASGNVPFSKLTVITPELLAKERDEKEKMMVALREAREKELESDIANIEAEELEKLKSNASSAESSEESEEDKLTALAKAAADKKIADEIDSMKAEEDKLLAEARRLEELMAALDMDDDDDDAL